MEKRRVWDLGQGRRRERRPMAMEGLASGARLCTVRSPGLVTVVG